MKVRLHQPHTHAGTRYVPGEEGIEIDVAAHDADFIVAAGVGRKVSPPRTQRADVASPEQAPDTNA